MVCIAAFIILLIVGIFVAFISIFRPKVGKRYLRTLKKSWSCFGKRITLQKCETGFGDDIKNNVLSKLIIRHPKWVKPVSAMIEIASILIVVITVWSLVEGAKAGLALYSLGTCNVKHAESCTLGSEVCSIDDNTEAKNPIEYIGLWLSDWGEIFGAIPDKFRDWNADNFDVVAIEIKNDGKPGAIDFFDPGCIICKQSFQAQLDSGFFENYNVKLVILPIQDNDGNFKFANSELIARYIYTVNKYEQKTSTDSVAFKIVKRIFTEKDKENRAYLDAFNDFYSSDEARELLKAWLKEFGLDDRAVDEISENITSNEIDEILKKNNDVVVNNIHAKGIPTLIYDNKKHTGRYEAK